MAQIGSYWLKNANYWLILAQNPSIPSSSSTNSASFSQISISQSVPTHCANCHRYQRKPPAISSTPRQYSNMLIRQFSDTLNKSVNYVNFCKHHVTFTLRKYVLSHKCINQIWLTSLRKSIFWKYTIA